MENMSNEVTAPVTTLAQRPDDWGLARAVHGDLVVMGMPRVNLLLIGRNRVTRSVLDLLLLDLQDPLASWHPGEPLTLPRTSRGGTLILNDISTLMPDEQRELLDWLDWDAGRTQVVSTTPVGLLARVHIGTFIERLYYRLNTICVDVTA
jgi:hypothetical protein